MASISPANASPVAAAAPGALVLLGHPGAHSLSPRFQRAALAAAGLSASYTAVDTPLSELASTLATLAHDRAAGNVTIPLKEAVCARCAHLTAVARRVGAVNTFWHTAHGELVGHNTDVHGAVVALNAVHSGQAPVAPANARRIVLLGAGGAAAGVLVAIGASVWTSRGTGQPSITVCARTPERALALVARCGVQASVVAWDAAAMAPLLGAADLVINSTSIGLHDASHPVPLTALAPHAALLDLVYRPGETAWARDARIAGHWAEDGLRMLVEQGAAAFEAWFAEPPSRSAMWDALEPRAAAPGGRR